MPEGHTVHRNARDLLKRFGGQQVIVSSPQRRFDDGAAQLDGQVLQGTQAHGKHLLADFGQGRVLHVHLGLYGRWTLGDGIPQAPRGAVRVRWEAEGGWADLRGPTACEVFDPDEVAALHARLGQDPLRRDADPGVAYARISRSKVSVGALLMQQEVVAGVGAVYRAETLFRCKVNPYRPGRDLEGSEWDAIWADLVALLRAGLKAGRIVTTDPVHRQKPRGTPRREDAYYVYRRVGEPCRLCGTPIAYALMVGRHLTWCPTCQPR
ncbi:MAG: Fpg/Nei family DNA glycosylase [Janthinobacterium lividum]